MNRHLFIDGPVDGQWLHADYEYWEVAVLKPLPVTPAQAPFDPEDACADTHTYKAVRFCEPDGMEITVYTHEDFTGSLIRRLVENYRPQHSDIDTESPKR